jgi:hypothetical protein
MNDKPIEIRIQNQDPNKISLEDAVKQLSADLPAVIAMNKLQAKIKREMFMAFTREGFTEDQAMFLIGR